MRLRKPVGIPRSVKLSTKLLKQNKNQNERRVFVTLLSTLRVCQNDYLSEGPNLVCYPASVKRIGFEIEFWRQLKLETFRGF